MYGDKEQKNKRLERIKAAVKGRPYGTFQADLARFLLCHNRMTPILQT
jgi:hypothetical protein